MKKLRILALIITLLFSACSGTSTQSSSIPNDTSLTEKQESDSRPTADSIDESSQMEDKGVSDYPKQAAEYMRMSLDGSVLLYFNPACEHGELVLPKVNYSKARMAPDGNHILCKANAGGAGEARWCGYSVVSLITNPAETYNYNGEQWGFQNHVWLDNNLIGFASGAVIGGQEDIWKPIQLFDYKYNPVDVTLQLPANENSEIVGIGYFQSGKRYVLACAEDKDTNDNPFSSNRMILFMFENNGAFVREIAVPDEYQSLYSPNLLTLIPNNPVVTAEGHILLTVQKKTDIEQGNYSKRVLLVLSPENQAIQELPCGDTLRLSADGETAFAISYDIDSNSTQPAILYFEGREDASVQGLPPDYLVANGYSGQFVPFDATIRDHHVYFIAENYADTAEPFCGLFYWNMAEDKNAERIELLQVLPGSEYCNLAGVSNEGFCYVLINGVVPESAEGDVQEHLKEKREYILNLID